MATISTNDIAEAIYQATKGKARPQQAKILAQAVRFLSRKRLLAQTPRILSRLQKIVSREEGTVIARVSSAEHLSEKLKKDLSRSLLKRYSGKAVSILEHIDKNLLGGVKIEVEDEVIDLTVKNRIKKLQAHLNES